MKNYILQEYTIQMKVWKILFKKNDPKISDIEKKECEKFVDELEIKKAIMQSLNDKSPGIDGIPVEFYQIFWNKILLTIV